jgi:hypothetical protein
MEMNFAVERYLTSLDAYDLDRVMDVFSEDAIYIKPRFLPGGEPTGDLVAAIGHDEIRQYFVERGPRTIRHLMRSIIRAGNVEHFEGLLAGIGVDPESAYIGSAILDAQGRIERYVCCAMSVTEGSKTALERPPATGLRKLLAQAPYGEGRYPFAHEAARAQR